MGTYLTGTAENIWRKIKLTGIGAVHMLLSKDKKFKPEVCVCVCPCTPTPGRVSLGVVCLQTMESKSRFREEVLFSFFCCFSRAVESTQQQPQQWRIL